MFLIFTNLCLCFRGAKVQNNYLNYYFYMLNIQYFEVNLERAD